MHASVDGDEAAAAPEEPQQHEITLANQGELPPHERTYGPVLLWEGANGTTPHLLFRPLRFTAEELWDDTPRQIDCDWQLTYAAPRMENCRLIHTLLADNGFTHTPTRPTFNIFWSGSRVKPALLLGLNEYQKVNHFPGTHEITRKDRLARTLLAAREVHGSAAYGFVPVTYVLPADTEALLEHMRELEHTSGERAAWIVKPSASSRGRGISIISHPHQLPRDDVVVSRYIARPLLIDRYKFDIRIYVAVTSFYPLRVYVFEEGLVRFSTEKYAWSEQGAASLHNQYMHLTNYSINKHSSKFVQNNDATADDTGSKWSLSALRRHLTRCGVDVPRLNALIDELIVKTLVAVEPGVTASCRRYCAHRNSCFELLGFDVLIDDCLKPWLLEVNLSPSLSTDTPLDLKVKSQMLAQLFTLVSIQVRVSV